MSHFRNLLRSIPILLVAACTVKPAPIQYGTDACHFCKMTIVDKTHAAQMVTKKGKQYKYDAIECLVNDLREAHNREEIAVIQLCDYFWPDHMIPAESAHFFISEAIPSPMGANLSATSAKDKARNIIKENGGLYLDWEELGNHFNTGN